MRLDGIAGGRRFSGARRSRQKWWVDVNARTDSSAGKWRPRVAVFVVGTAIVIAAIVGGWLGLRKAGGALFSHNSRYTIRNLDIRNGGPLVREFIRDKMNINEGVNLFAFSIGELRGQFLGSAPSFRGMDIRRRLPDTLEIEVVERTPLARVGARADLAVDREGFVFSTGSRQRHLPLITGCDGAPLRPADSLDGLALDAVRLLDVCEKMEVGREVAIASVDVSGKAGGRDGAIRLTLEEGTTVLLWWRRAADADAAASRDLQERLRYLRAVLRKSRAEGKPAPRVINLTLDTFKSNTVATF